MNFNRSIVQWIANTEQYALFKYINSLIFCLKIKMTAKVIIYQFLINVSKYSQFMASSRAKCLIRSLSSLDESERIGHLARQDKFMVVGPELKEITFNSKYPGTCTYLMLWSWTIFFYRALYVSGRLQPCHSTFIVNNFHVTIYLPWIPGLSWILYNVLV